MSNFDYEMALYGGLLIGGAALLLMVTLGRIAGISGVVGALFVHDIGVMGWRIAFLAGLVVAPVIAMWLGINLPKVELVSAKLPLIAGGLLVGFGTQLGSGCTSGHGVCGISRFSKRSVVATCIFMAVAASVVYVSRHLLGGFA